MPPEISAENNSRMSRVPMSNDEWKQQFFSFRNVLFRLEALSSYDAPAETPIMEAFARGIDLPPAETKLQKYFEDLRGFIASGKTVERVHVVPEVLTDYLKWEIFWLYRHFEEIGVKVYLLEASKHPELAQGAYEFYLLDNQQLIHVDYDSKGAFLALGRETDLKVIERANEMRRSFLLHGTPLAEYMKNRQ